MLGKGRCTEDPGGPPVNRPGGGVGAQELQDRKHQRYFLIFTVPWTA